MPMGIPSHLHCFTFHLRDESPFDLFWLTSHTISVQCDEDRCSIINHAEVMAFARFILQRQHMLIVTMPLLMLRHEDRVHTSTSNTKFPPSQSRAGRPQFLASQVLAIQLYRGPDCTSQQLPPCFDGPPDSIRGPETSIRACRLSATEASSLICGS